MESEEKSSTLQTLSVASAGFRSDGPEADLVLRAARTFVSGTEVDGLHVDLAQSLDWGAVERKADRHSVLPLVIYALRQSGWSSIPKEARTRLQQRFSASAQRSLSGVNEWLRLLHAFEIEGISVISLKGPALALLAYRNVALREFLDLDLLVLPADVYRAREILKREGYRLRSPFAVETDTALLRFKNRQLDFLNDERGMLVDLHWGVLHEMFPFQLPVDEFFRSARLVNREGMSFLALSPEHLLLYLCVHGTKHCWLNLIWLCDVACHLRVAQELDWELCLRLAKDANCDLVLKHSLLLAHQVLGLDLPLPSELYCKSENAQALADTALSFLSRPAGELDYVEALRYHLAFAKGLNHRARLVFDRVFVPDEPGRLESRLAPPLRFLFYTARPIRFVFARAFKAFRSLQVEI
jgi:Uncharacterised nucleotidyltransferase